MYRYSGGSLKEKLLKIARENFVHRHYKRTVELAKFYRQIMDGEDQDKYVLEYKPGESKEQKQQVLNLYNSRTAFTANRVYASFKEVERSDNVVNNIIFHGEDEKQDRKKKLQDVLDTLNGTEDINSYLHDVMLRLNFYDPNAFLLVEFDKIDGKQIRPYPLEVMSENIADFEFEKGILQYVVCLYPCEVCERAGSMIYIEGKIETVTRSGREYTLYGPDIAFKLTELGEAGKAVFDSNEIDGEVVEIKDSKSGVTNLFVIKEYETKSKQVPAFRVGYMRDSKTDWQTCVGILHPAEKLFIEQIRIKREYDLHRALHGFLQKFSYVEACDFEHVSEENGRDSCSNGYLKISGDKCPACKGSGTKVHTTVQDVILIKMPVNSTLEERIPLKNMVHYVEIPQYIIEGHKQDLKDNDRDVALAIFNTNVFDRSEIAITATEKRLNLQAAYNVYSDYGHRWSEAYVFFVMQIAIYIDIDDGLTANHSFSNDFKLETVEEFLSQRKEAIDSGSPYSVISSIDMSILAKLNQDDLTYVERIKAQEKFRPFRGKKDQEVIFIISMLPEVHPKRILWTYFDDIFEEIYSKKEYAIFHKFPFSVQKKIVEDHVQHIIKSEQTYYPSLNFREL